MNMNNENQVAEKVSAYIDEALSADDIDPLIAAHEAASRKEGHFSLAARYHIIGDALRGELSDASMIDVSAQIHQALRDESFDVVASAKPVKKVSLADRFDFSAWLESFARPLTGMAVAASVAVLMVVTVVQLESPEGDQQLAASPVNLPAGASGTLIANKPLTEDSAKEQRLADFDVYLTEHAEFAAQDTLQGRIPYVRAVSYEAE